MKDGYKLTMAEFKGETIASLRAIKEDIGDIKTDLKTKACKKDFDNLRDQINNIKLASAIIGGVGGILTAAGAFFGLKRL